MSCSCHYYLQLLILAALIPHVICQTCEFRFWMIGDTTYASSGWYQLSINELNTLKSQFITQYNNDGGLLPIASYYVSNCKICQGPDIAVGYTWTTFVCPTSDNSAYIWDMVAGTYYRFKYSSTPVYNPLSTTGTFQALSILCGASQHSIFARCWIPSPTPSPTFNPTPSPTKYPTISPTYNPTKTPSDTPSNNPSISPTYSPTVTTMSPSNNPTYSPSNNPSISPTNIPTMTPRYWICDETCDNNNNKIIIKVFFWFNSWIVYDLNNMQCFLYKIFSSWFQYFDFVNHFDICDIEINVISSLPKNNDNIQCEFPPCLINTNNLRRMLLTSNDGNVSMRLIASDSGTFSSVNGLSFDSMALEFESEFSNNFDGLSIDVILSSEQSEQPQSEPETTIHESKDEFSDNNSDKDGLITGLDNNITIILFGLLGVIILLICSVGCFLYCKRKRNYERAMSEKVTNLEKKIAAMKVTEIQSSSPTNMTVMNSINDTFNTTAGEETDGMAVQRINSQSSIMNQHVQLNNAAIQMMQMNSMMNIQLQTPLATEGDINAQNLHVNTSGDIPSSNDDKNGDDKSSDTDDNEMLYSTQPTVGDDNEENNINVADDGDNDEYEYYYEDDM